MEVNGFNLKMVRGDTETINIDMKEDGVSKAFVEGDTVRFTVKKRTTDENNALQKVVTIFNEGKALINISHDDTKDLSTGVYEYDIQTTFADETVRTVVGPAEFKLSPEVTRE